MHKPIPIPTAMTILEAKGALGKEWKIAEGTRWGRVLQK